MSESQKLRRSQVVLALAKMAANSTYEVNVAGMQRGAALYEEVAKVINSLQLDEACERNEQDKLMQNQAVQAATDEEIVDES